ncbi:hypothetical protein DZC72_04290 [Maribacter algicola]|uniref:Uncharacterized protein n=1 Tax=Maribacter algicola TaxID=2498892 RepID=A0A3R8RPF3_9FLAO|nr:hypothetical protein [Maribacter algicola]RRQ49815.1 hypothetical protein DZC72_04290 [Maribacter algicola]
MNDLLDFLFLKHPSDLDTFVRTTTNVYFEQFHEQYLNEEEAMYLLLKSTIEDVDKIINESEINYLSENANDNLSLVILCVYLKRLSFSDDEEYHDTCTFEFERLYKVIGSIFNEVSPSDCEVSLMMTNETKNLFYNFWNLKD